MKDLIGYSVVNESIWATDGRWIAARTSNPDPAIRASIDIADYVDVINAERASLEIIGEQRSAGLLHARWLLKCRGHDGSSYGTQMQTVAVSTAWEPFSVAFAHLAPGTVNIEIVLTAAQSWISASGCTCEPFARHDEYIHFANLRVLVATTRRASRIQTESRFRAA